MALNLKKLANNVIHNNRVKELNLNRSHVRIIVAATFEEIANALVVDGKIKIHNLFQLCVTEVKGRKIKNFKGEEVKSRDSHRVTVKLSDRLKLLINK